MIYYSCALWSLEHDDGPKLISALEKIPQSFSVIGFNNLFVG